MIEIAIIGSDMQEVIGTAIAIYLLSNKVLVKISFINFKFFFDFRSISISQYTFVGWSTNHYSRYIHVPISG